MASVLTDHEFKLFRDKIYDESGIHFSVVNRPILNSRIRERLKLKQIDSPLEYYNVIISDSAELNHLLDSVTTNLTSFFRNEAHFSSLYSVVLPEITKRKDKFKRLKVWSAGCSTGEEAYSVAIKIVESIVDYKSWKIDILASDLSLKSLIKAKEGYYSEDKLAGVDPTYLARYFDISNSGYKVKDFIKQLIRFDYHNLNFDNGERSFDIIFCRNVIIYFDRAAQINVIKGFYQCLNEHGYLYIGHSESLFGMKSGFKFYKINDACIYRKV